MNPFDNTQTNRIIKEISSPSSNVVGIIILTRDYITSNTTYSNPEIISLADPSLSEDIIPLSFDKVGDIY